MERLLESEMLAAVELARDIRPRIEQLLAARTVAR
jgi:hypothetical protein